MRLSRPIATRVLADIVLTMLGLLLAFLARYIVEIAATESAVTAQRLWRNMTVQYFATSWLLVACVILAFAASGVYHRVRVYRRRFKLARVLQATALAHLLWGRRWLQLPLFWIAAFAGSLVTYAIGLRLPLALPAPAGVPVLEVLLGAWMLLIVASRLRV